MEHTARGGRRRQSWVLGAGWVRRWGMTLVLCPPSGAAQARLPQHSHPGNRVVRAKSLSRAWLWPPPGQDVPCSGRRDAGLPYGSASYRTPINVVDFIIKAWALPVKPWGENPGQGSPIYFLSRICYNKSMRGVTYAPYCVF